MKQNSPFSFRHTLLFIESIPQLLEAFHSIENINDNELKIFEPIDHWHHLYEKTLDELHAINSKTLNAEDEVDHIAKSPDKLVATVNMMKRSVIEADNQNLDDSSVFTAYYPLMKSYISVIYNKMSLNEMIQKIANSNNPADLIQRALKIDKTIIHCLPVANHLKQAVLLNDKKILKAISNGMNTSYSKRVKFPELILGLYELHRLNYLQKMTNEELYEIFVIKNHFWPDKEEVAKKEARGIEIDKDPESFRKIVTRIKKDLSLY